MVEDSPSLEELKRNFKGVKWKPFKLGCEYYPDPEKTVRSHFKMLEGKDLAKRFKPYYDRLLKINKLI
tara:strand:+ start:5588 stop:5791 length:204 start_codon:yes stop_codon:yes gene_type:complete